MNGNLTSTIAEVARDALAQEIMKHSGVTDLNGSNVREWISNPNNVGNLNLDTDDAINAWEHAYFKQAMAALMPVDPLIVDLDGNGIETTTKEN